MFRVLMLAAAALFGCESVNDSVLPERPFDAPECSPMPVGEIELHCEFEVVGSVAEGAIYCSDGTGQSGFGVYYSGAEPTGYGHISHLGVHHTACDDGVQTAISLTGDDGDVCMYLCYWPGHADCLERPPCAQP